MRNFLVGTIVLSLMLLIVFWQQAPDENFHLVMCDVGQGDGFVLWQGSTQVVIDGGPSADKMLACVQKNIPFWDTTIELVVASHADADHIAGLPPLIQRYRVGAVLFSQSDKQTAVFERFNQVVQMRDQGGTQVLRPYPGQIFQLGADFSAVVLWPESILEINRKISQASNQPPTSLANSSSIDSGNGVGGAMSPPTSAAAEHFLQALETLPEANKTTPVLDENDRSIILLVRFHNQTFLFTGDAGQQAELALLSNPLISEVDVLKTSHHGSKSGTSQQFLDVTRPEWALISVGSSNSYGHPNQEVLHRLNQLGTRVLRTDLLGEVELISDGNQIWTAN